MIILGIDPGLATIGFGVIEKTGGDIKVIDYGIISTPKDLTLPDRLKMIEEGVVSLFSTYKPEVVAIEELFFNNNARTAIAVAEARGVILLTCRKLAKELYEYTPLQIKQGLTGYGRADKRQMQEMVKNLLKLKSIPRPDDAADALAVAICHSQTSRFGNLFKIN